MSIAKELSQHFKNIYFGGNWTVTHYKAVLEDLTWQEATTKLAGQNSILTLVYHTHYFNAEGIKMLQLALFEAKDELSFQPPEIKSAKAWQNFLEHVYKTAEALANEVGKLNDEQLLKPLAPQFKKSTFYNLNGILEHLHYHLGQIVILKKLIRQHGK